MEEYEVDLRDYVRILWKEKWIVIVTFLVAVGTALAISYGLPKQYRTETALLILPPLAREVGGEVTGTVYSPETYKSLALASDLLQEVAAKVYPEGDRPSALELKDRIKVEIEQTTAKEFPGRFPLYLRVSFTGTDPARLQQLAQAWTEGFTARNAQLFMSRAAQSYEYIKENFDEVEEELLAKEEEKRVYQKENPLEILQAEVAVLEADYKTYLDQLEEKRRELASKEATLAALTEALAQEPQYLTLMRTVSNEALWNFLAQRATPQELSSLPSLALQDQQLNSVYLDLRSQLASTQVAVKTLREEIAYLESALSTTLAELKEKQARLVEVQAELERLDREISVLKSSYTSLAEKLQEARIAKAETAEPIRVVEAPVVPERPIGPSKKMNVAVAGVLGLFLGVLLAFFAHWLGEGSRPPHDQGTDQPAQAPGGKEEPNP
ncbi:hypothetical protein H5T52_04665 [Candidatus Bipolaricaulota bacterium]|nr:hypothetical protein [Candidatus Bipolaricaulota bacterium]